MAGREFFYVSPENLSESEKDIVSQLEKVSGVTFVTKDRWQVNTYHLTFGENLRRVSVEISFHDRESGADIAIKNIGSSVRGEGLGSQAVQAIVSWSVQQNYKKIEATQVQVASEEFWTRNGFVYDDYEGNISNDWTYKGNE